MSAPFADRGAPFGAVVREGSVEHVWLLKRRRWREAYERWLDGGRRELTVEPTPEPWPSDRLLTIPDDLAGDLG
jgi:hypothetical protein